MLDLAFMTSNVEKPPDTAALAAEAAVAVRILVFPGFLLLKRGPVKMHLTLTPQNLPDAD
eukprot:gene40132-49637_t